MAAGCGKSADEGSSSSGGGSAKSGKKVALVIAQGGLGDKSYNDLANTGFEKAVKETGVEGRAIESKDVVAQAEPILNRATTSGFGLIVDLEFSHGDAIKKVADANPKTQYALINVPLEGANQTGVVFQEQEGSYLAGVLAARMTTRPAIKRINPEKTIGVIGGTKSAGIDKFIVGYIQGARDTDPKVKVAYSNNFGDPAMASRWPRRCSGGRRHRLPGRRRHRAGVIQAAKEKQPLRHRRRHRPGRTAPGSVLTDDQAHRPRGRAARQGLCRRQVQGRRDRTLGLKEDGVGLSEMKHTKKDVPADVMADVERPSRTSSTARSRSGTSSTRAIRTTTSPDVGGPSLRRRPGGHAPLRRRRRQRRGHPRASRAATCTRSWRQRRRQDDADADPPGSDRPDEGTVVVDGEAVRLSGPADATRRGIGMVHQEFMLVAELTLLENLVLGREPVSAAAASTGGRAPRPRRWPAASASRSTGTGPPARLDDARQRLEILRLLYRGADVLILDEPTAVLAPAAESPSCSRCCGDCATAVARSCSSATSCRRCWPSPTDHRDARRQGHRDGRRGGSRPTQLARMMVGESVRPG